MVHNIFSNCRERRVEEEEQARVAMRKRKFFNELLNLVREVQLQGQSVFKKRKQRNDNVQVCIYYFIRA